MYFRSTLFIFLLTCLSLLCSCNQEKSSNKQPVKTEKSIKDAPLQQKERSSKSSKIDAEQLARARYIIENSPMDLVKNAKSEEKYKMLCTTCHGSKGGLGIGGAPDLTKSKATLEENVAQIYFGRGLMSPYKGVLKEPEIVAMAKYVESLRK